MQILFILEKTTEGHQLFIHVWGDQFEFGQMQDVKAYILGGS
jgi:hypothetical protein